jgi:hypothetical protein
MSWFSDILDWGSNQLGYGNVSSYLPDVTNTGTWDYLWNQPKPGTSAGWGQGTLGSMFSPQSIMGALATGTDYFNTQAAQDQSTKMTDYQAAQASLAQQALDWQKQNAIDARQAALDAAAASAASAQQIAAMQTAAQKAIAAYNGQVEAAMGRTTSHLAGGKNVSDALIQLGQLATRPYL